jgi:single-strand DNA-binding protein
MYTSADNNINQIGRLTANPELRALPTGTSVCELRLAVRGAGNSQGDAGFFDIAVYGPSGEAAAEHLTTGSLVAVHGRLQHRTWTAEDGTKRSAVRIVGDVKFLGRKRTDDEVAADEIDVDAVPIAASGINGDDIPS